MGLIESWGTGTNRMIRKCEEHGLPRPRFEEKAASFVVTFNKLAEDYLRSLGLNERQVGAVKYLLDNGAITNR